MARPWPFSGEGITYSRLQREAEAFAGWLRRRAGVIPGDRVIPYMQNSPQWAIAYRGETVKALVVLRPERLSMVQESDFIEWSRERMPSFKYPRIVEFVPSLPKSPAGKILWRELQQCETQASLGCDTLTQKGTST